MDDDNKKSHNFHSDTINDQALWDHVTKDVEPLSPKTKDQSADSLNKTPAKSPRKHVIRTQMDVPYMEAPQSPQRAEIDRKTAQRLARGQMPIDGRLDLHGLNQRDAYDALMRCIPNAYHSGKRCILVITGKGGRMYGGASMLDQTPGVLRTKTPQWLNEAPLSDYVLKTKTARPKDGGEGALYVLIKRKRD